MRADWSDDSIDSSFDGISDGAIVFIASVTIAFYAVWFYGAWNIGLAIWRAMHAIF